MQTGVIYIATLNDMSYIGQTRNFQKRKRDHLKAYKNSHFHFAIRKYGADAVEWRLLEEDIPVDRLADREELWIAFYDTYHNGYNMTEGGDVSPMLYPDIVRRSAAKQSATMREKGKRGEQHTQTPEGRKGQSQRMKDRARRREHPMHDPEILKKKAKHQSEFMLKQSARGENPMHRPEIVEKVRQSRFMNDARKRLMNQLEAGQEFMLDMELDESDD